MIVFVGNLTKLFYLFTLLEVAYLFIISFKTPLKRCFFVAYFLKLKL